MVIEARPHVELLLEVLLQWHVDKRDFRGGEFHRCCQATLHDREIAGGEVMVQLGYVGAVLDPSNLRQACRVDAGAGDDDQAQPGNRAVCGRSSRDYATQ